MCSRFRVLVRPVPLVMLVLAGTIDFAWAQSESTLRGRVVAAADDSGLAQAVVTLRPVSTGDSLTTVSDSAGRFVFPNVRPGEYALTASFEGFLPRQLGLVLEPREVRTVTVPLDVGGFGLTVSVTGDLPLPGAHSPSSTLLTIDRLDTLPVFERTNLPDAIVTAAPGMIRGHDDFVHIRGHEIALNPLIDGVSFWENTHALFSSGLSPDVIETANVMTGGFPAEYGNRFGGVVDIVTRSGLRMENGGAVTLSGGGAGRRRVTGELGGNRGPFGYFVFGSVFESDRFLSPPDPETIHDEARGGHAFVRLDGNLGRTGSLSLVLMGDGANFEIPKTPRDIELRPAANAHQRTRQQSAILGWTRSWSDAALTASSYQRWSRMRLLPAAGPLTAQARLDRELLTVGGKVDGTRLVGRHAMKFGVDLVQLRPREDLSYGYGGYRDLTHLLGLPHIHVTGQAITFSGRDSGSQISAYAQDDIQFGDRLTANVGLRVDRYGLVVSDAHASPRVNLALRAGAGTVLHASYNRFFVPPPIEGILSNSAGLTRSIQEIAIALPALQPTTENQFELGFAMPLRPLELVLTGYYRTTDNPVHTTVWPDSRIYSYASFDKGQAYGLEAKAEVSTLARYGITGYMNYALGRVHFYNPVTGGFVTEAAHLTDTSRFLAPMDQTHTLTGGGTYRHAATGVWFGTAIEYGSGTPIGHGLATHEHLESDTDHEHASPSGNTQRVPAHFTGKLSLGVDVLQDAKRRPKLTLRLDVENVTNGVYLIARESEFSPSQYSIPRLVSATVKVRF